MVSTSLVPLVKYSDNTGTRIEEERKEPAGDGDQQKGVREALC